MSDQERPGRPLSLREDAVLLWILCELGESEAVEALHEQSRVVSVVGGPPTMLELSVPTRVLGAPIGDGPLPVRAIATDEQGGLIGEVLIWVSGGYLSALEYAWYEDDPPSNLPCPRLFRSQ